MNLQRNMEAIFFVAAVTSVSALAAAQPPAPQVQYVENTIGTEFKPAVIVIHGKRPSISEKIEYKVTDAMENIGLAAN